MYNYRIVRLYANISAIRGKTKQERRLIRGRIISRYLERINAFGHDPYSHPQNDNAIFHPKLEKYLPLVFRESRVFSKAQDILFPTEVEHAERIMVIVVPEHNAMSGGIYSMFSIANQMRDIKHEHGYEILIVTRPNPEDLTYLRQTNFRNHENVFRFSQLTRCRGAKEIYLHIPEYAVDMFCEFLSEDEKTFLKSLEKLSINILNQNVELMPRIQEIQRLHELTPHITQSVAHHAYFSQQHTDQCRIPSLLLPAYTDLSNYTPFEFEQKEDLIIYSPDDAPHKAETLAEIAKFLPEFQLMEINGITFEKYMELARRCKFSISFGEGFDGYIAQPIHMGGIGFTVYNESFFPSDRFLSYQNIFSSNEDMVENIVARIRALLENPEAYRSLNEGFCSEYAKLYSLEGYKRQIRKLASQQFELFPKNHTENHQLTHHRTGN